MSNDARISLSNPYQFSRFREYMNILNRRKADLSDYDKQFYRKLRDGYDLAGREMSITSKQMTHLHMVALELESDRYGQ